MVEIAVRDHGLGIPPDQAPLLFQRFVRLPRDLASATVGNGLGLYLCRELAEAMGGHIRVESIGVEGEGSTFYLRLPVASPSAGSEAT
jgi:signal transduction histidine kinase